MSKKENMSLQRFKELVEAYGAEASRWPDAERAAALGFMDANPAEAALVLAPARALDGALEGAREQTADTAFLAARILKAAQESDAYENAANDQIGGPARLPRSRWKSIAATFVITTSLGFAAGQSAAAKSDRIAEAETLLSLTLDNPYDNSSMWEDT